MGSPFLIVSVFCLAVATCMAQTTGVAKPAAAYNPLGYNAAYNTGSYTAGAYNPGAYTAGAYNPYAANAYDYTGYSGYAGYGATGAAAAYKYPYNTASTTYNSDYCRRIATLGYTNPAAAAQCAGYNKGYPYQDASRYNAYNPAAYNPAAYNTGAYNTGAYNAGAYNPAAYNAYSKPVAGATSAGYYNPATYTAGQYYNPALRYNTPSTAVPPTYNTAYNQYK